MTVSKYLGLLLATTALASPALAGQHPGDLDATFGVGGKVVQPGFSYVEDVIALPDGKTLVVGSRPDEADLRSDIMIARYHADGSADSSFGTGGVVITDFDGSHDLGRAAAVQPDGKIVVVGQYGDDVDDRWFFDLVVVRYAPDGSLDASFGDGGKVTVDFFGDYDVGTGVALRGDGKIVVVVGGAGEGDISNFKVAQLNGDGSPDTGFGLGGRAMATFPSPYYGASSESVLIQADGKIVLAGTAFAAGFETYRSDYALARFLADGTLDQGFGEAGLVITDLGMKDDLASAAALQPDGRIVVVGITGDIYHPELSSFAVVRYLGDGSLDPSFGAGGVARSDVGDFEEMGDVAIQADGKILVAWHGHYWNQVWHHDFALVRFTPDGRPDRSFGRNGIVLTDFQQEPDNATSLAIQADGKIVVAGDNSIRFNQGSNGLIARYHSEGDVRPDIKANGADGRVFVSPGDAVEVTISLDPGPRAGQQATWWLLADTPAGVRSYDFEAGTWVAGTRPGYHGPLIAFSDRRVFAAPAPPAGSVTLYFAVKLGASNNPELPYLDEVGVTVAP